MFLLTGVCLWGNNLSYIVGVKLAGATAAGVWQPATPVFITLMAIFFKYEKATFLKFFGIFVAGAGCVVVVLLGAQSKSVLINPAWGNVVLLTQAVVNSAFYVSEKPLLERYSPIMVVGYSYLVATVLMILTALLFNSTPTLLHTVCPNCDGGWSLPGDAWVGILYWIFAGSIAGYLLPYYHIRTHINPRFYSLDGRLSPPLLPYTDTH